MKMRIIGLVILLFCSGAFAASKAKARPDALTPQSVMRQVESIGARATIQKLHEPNAHRWTAVLHRVQSGKPEWLAVARELSRGLDPETSAEMRNALAKALAVNPGGVLRLIDGRVIDIDYLCGVPFTNRTPAFLKGYRADATRALKKLKDPDVEDYKSQCISKIERSVEIERLLQLGAPEPEPAPESTNEAPAKE